MVSSTANNKKLLHGRHKERAVEVGSHSKEANNKQKRTERVAFERSETKRRNRESRSHSKEANHLVRKLCKVEPVVEQAVRIDETVSASIPSFQYATSRRRGRNLQHVC